MRLYVAVAALVISTCSYANSGHLASQYYWYQHLCSMIPECVAEQNAKHEAMKMKRLEREHRLATPSQPRKRIPEWDLMEERLRAVKILRRTKD